MRSIKLFRASLLISCFIVFFAVVSGWVGPHAVWADLPPQVANPPSRPVPKAVSLYLTKKGESFFENNLELLINGFGYSAREGYFPEIRYTAKEPIPLEELARTSPETAETIRSIRELLQNWFMGFVINDPQPDVLAKNSGYRISYQRLALRVDRELLEKLGRKSGAVFVLDVEIDSLLVGGELVSVRDIQNDFLGAFEVLSPMFFLIPNSNSLKLKIPFYVDVVSGRDVVVEALPMSSNFGGTTFDFTFQGLTIPDMVVEINGRRFPLNKNHMIETFEQLKPRLLAQVGEMVDKLATTALPELLTEAIRKAQPDDLSQLNRMRPPAIPEDSTDPDFLWGLRVTKIGTGADVIGIELDGFVYDPMNPKSQPESGADARGPVSLAGSNPNDYDVAVVVNRGLVNRFLQLSYQRGYLKEIESDKGEELKFFAAPRIDAYGPSAGRNSSEPQLKVRVAISSPIAGLKSILFKGDARFHVDLIGRLIQPGEGGVFRVVLDAADESSVSVDKSSLTWLGRRMIGSVRDGIKKRLRETASEWKKKPMEVPGEIPLNLSVFGQELSSQGLRMDKNGYLVMFLNFGGTN